MNSAPGHSDPDVVVPAYLPRQWREHVESHFAVGIDIGQMRDPSAVSVIERRQLWKPDGRYSNRRMRQGEPEYRLLYAHRLPLLMPYPMQGQEIARLLSSRSELSGAVILADCTGVGRAAIDGWRSEIPDVIGVILTAGRDVRWERGDLFLAKAVLIQEMQSALHYQTLRFPLNLPEADVIARECADFTVSYRATGALQWNAQSGSHDDLVISIALALWGAQHEVGRGIQLIRSTGF